MIDKSNLKQNKQTNKKQKTKQKKNMGCGRFSKLYKIYKEKSMVIWSQIYKDYTDLSK